MTVSFLVPASKSVTHRAYLLCAQSHHAVRIENPLVSLDTNATLRGLKQLGATIEEGANYVRIGKGSRANSPIRIDCQNSGTSLRFLTALAATQANPTTLHGDQSLQSRPMAALNQALTNAGASFKQVWPISLAGPIKPGAFSFERIESSQFVSALMLTLPFLQGNSTITCPAESPSLSYAGLSQKIANEFGVSINNESRGSWSTSGNQEVMTRNFSVEGDWSAAAFAIVAATILGTRIRMAGLTMETSQPDESITKILQPLGGVFRQESNCVIYDPPPVPCLREVNVSQNPDLFPPLAVLAAFSEGTTTFRGGASLRQKESNRIDAMATGLNRMGIKCIRLADGLKIRGGKPNGAAVSSFGDHRIHMAMQVAGLAATGETIVDNPEIVAVSNPSFLTELKNFRLVAQ